MKSIINSRKATKPYDSQSIFSEGFDVARKDYPNPAGAFGVDIRNRILAEKLESRSIQDARWLDGYMAWCSGKYKDAVLP